MISLDKLFQLKQLPDPLNIPNREMIINLMYEKYNDYQSLDDIDKFYSTKTSDTSYYMNSIRPILKCLFDLETMENGVHIGFHPDISEDHKPLTPLILNESQNQVYNIYKKDGIKSGIICHATGTGKTNIIFLSMSNHNTIFHFCHYKNILRQSYYDEHDNFDYEKFRQRKPFFNIWDYVIYDLSNVNERKNIMNNIEKINKLPCKKIFLINPQYIANDDIKYKLLPKPDLIVHDECHTITGNHTYNFLHHFKNMGSIMIGLSATPIRCIKKQHNYVILRNIYGDLIISSYENITAIIKQAILNIEIYWFEAQLNDKSVNNRNNIFNINNCINRIIFVAPKLPNKKILVWCGTTPHADNLFDHIKKNQQMVQIFNNGIFIDHSKIEDTNNQSYKDFMRIESNCIMICADKYREGSDIHYLDCIMFADLVKKKGELPFIQCIGRVQRKGYNKTVGYVIDHYDTSIDQSKKIKDIIDKLIGYYYEFFNYAEQNINKFEKASKMFEDILKRYSFDKSLDGNIINIKLNDKLSIKIYSGLTDTNFNNVKIKFRPAIIEHLGKELNLEENEKLRLEYDRFVRNNTKFYHIKDKTEYLEKIDDIGLEPDPETKYIGIWKNWYDYLGIDTSIYPQTKEEWKHKCIRLKIKNKKDYLTKITDDMPKMPEELYKIKNIYGIIDDTIDV